MSSYDIRKSIFFGEVFSAPLTKLGHIMFVLSLFHAYLMQFHVKDEFLNNCLLLDKLALAIFGAEFAIVTGWRVSILLLIKTEQFDILHKLKQVEAKIHKKMYRRKIEKVHVPI